MQYCSTSSTVKMYVAHIVLCFIFIAFVDCQRLPAIPTIDSCPPLTDIGVCEVTCYTDNDCVGYNKCCDTSCGGSVCTRPVTTRRNTDLEKPGYCPNPTDESLNIPWVCSNRCSSDSDCRGRLKCCQSGCGGYGCMVPSPVPTNYEPFNLFN